MIFRQLFDSVSSTYTYLLAARSGGEALRTSNHLDGGTDAWGKAKLPLIQPA